MIEKLIRGGGDFPFFIEKNTEAIIFPKAQRTVRVNENDSNYVIWVYNQRKLKSRAWSVQLSYFNFITYKAKALIFLHYVDAN